MLNRDTEATAARHFANKKSRVLLDGREILVGKDWDARRWELLCRCKGYCEYLDWDGTRCNESAQDPHHVIPRSLGRDDRLTNLLALCRYHHKEVDPRKIGGRK